LNIKLNYVLLGHERAAIGWFRKQGINETMIAKSTQPRYPKLPKVRVSPDFSDGQVGLPIVKIAELKNGITGQTKFTTQEFDDKYLIENADILFSWSGNPDTSIDTFIWTGGAGWLNQHIFKIVPHSDNDHCFVYLLLRSLKKVFADIARDKQTTGLGHVTAGDLKRLNVCKPRSAELRAFNAIVEPLQAKWLEVVAERQSLALLRDALLPKLLSGQIRIPDAEKLVAGAV
jgi:type I restriction enzyme S subunit